VLLRGLQVRYVLVGDDFQFGAKRAGDYAMLDAAGEAAGFDVARMNSYEVRGVRVSSSAVREALAAGRMDLAARLLGRPYSSRPCGAWAQAGRERELGFRTLNMRIFRHWTGRRPAGFLWSARARPGPRTRGWRGQPGRAAHAGPQTSTAAACCWKPIA
jgi:hypothetical protein